MRIEHSQFVIQLSDFVNERIFFTHQLIIADEQLLIVICRILLFPRLSDLYAVHKDFLDDLLKEGYLFFGLGQVGFLSLLKFLCELLGVEDVL